MRRPAGLAKTILATMVVLAAGGLAATAGRAVAGDEAGAASRVVVSLRVSGELFAPAEADSEPVREPIALDARFDFVERPEPAAGPGGVARRYTTAAASIQVGEREADQKTDKAGDESAGEGPAAPPAPAGSW